MQINFPVNFNLIILTVKSGSLYFPKNAHNFPKNRIFWKVFLSCTLCTNYLFIELEFLTKLNVKNDRSKFSNLSNWKEEAWKNQGFNEIRTRGVPMGYNC